MFKNVADLSDPKNKRYKMHFAKPFEYQQELLGHIMWILAGLIWALWEQLFGFLKQIENVNISNL